MGAADETASETNLGDGFRFANFVASIMKTFKEVIMEKLKKVLNFILVDHYAAALLVEAVIVLYDGNKFEKLWLTGVAAIIGTKIDNNCIARRKCEE